MSQMYLPTQVYCISGPCDLCGVSHFQISQWNSPSLFVAVRLVPVMLCMELLVAVAMLVTIDKAQGHLPSPLPPQWGSISVHSLPLHGVSCGLITRDSLFWLQNSIRSHIGWLWSSLPNYGSSHARYAKIFLLRHNLPHGPVGTVSCNRLLGWKNNTVENIFLKLHCISC